MIYPKPFLDYCLAADLKLTSIRKIVLFILWDSSKPLKAYELLDKLTTHNANLKAPSVYRALDYFIAMGVVHKLESLQAYTLCQEATKHQPCEILMICENCQQVNEFYDEAFYFSLKGLLLKHHFHVNQGNLELKGLCCHCQARS